MIKTDEFEIATKEEALWLEEREECLKRIKAFKKNLKINEAYLQMCEEKIKNNTFPLPKGGGIQETKQRVNSVEFKGELRKCLNCGDVKIWDYPNERKCPSPTNLKKPLHRWRPFKEAWLTEEENKSIDRQIELDKKVKHRKPLFFNELNSESISPPNPEGMGIRNGRII